MSIAVSGMLPVSLPRFAPSNANSTGQTNTKPQSDLNALVSDGGDALDFDLLAEYLLEDAGPSLDSILPTFEFNVEATSNSGVVSPEQSEDGMPHLPTNKSGSIAQVENLIAAHAMAQANRPVMQAIAPAPPGMPARPGLTQAGTPMPPAPGPGAFPLAPGVHTAKALPMVMQQHAKPPAPVSNKRRRVDEATYMQPPPSGRGRHKSQAQIDRRRERNRILARRTRLRKKFFFESLQKDVVDLQRENAALKEIVSAKLDPAVAKALLEQSNAAEQLPESILEACGESTQMDSQDFNLIKSIRSSQQSFIITDPSLQDNPIVYASADFLKLTGYEREQVLGRNCRFLQGTETSPSKVESVRKAVLNGDDVSVTMINYTADGTAFWNKLFIAALRDAQNNIVNFIGVIVKVAGPEADDPEAGKRLPGEEDASDEDHEKDNEDDQEEFKDIYESGNRS